jgi:hypothetical protein
MIDILLGSITTKYIGDQKTLLFNSFKNCQTKNTVKTVNRSPITRTINNDQLNGAGIGKN